MEDGQTTLVICQDDDTLRAGSWSRYGVNGICARTAPMFVLAARLRATRLIQTTHVFYEYQPCRIEQCNQQSTQYIPAPGIPNSVAQLPIFKQRHLAHGICQWEVIETATVLWS